METEAAPVGQAHIYWTEPPSTLVLPPGQQEMTSIFFSSIDQESIKAMAAFKMALNIRASTPHALRETHENAWIDKWEQGSIDIEGK
jgi:trehalose/maltose hydrolase-like predicted phosphorylase